MAELKPCPFCGGKARVSFKDKWWGGWNGKGNHRKAYSVQVICNKCHSRGKPITTDWLVNPNPYCSVYSGRYTVDSLDNPVIKKNTEMFAPYVEQAIEAWNKRTERPKGRWIPVTERLPEKHGGDYVCLLKFPNANKPFPYCLIWHAYGDNGYVNGPHFSDEGLDGMKVTHWMPLPEPPKEDAE